MFDWLFPPRCPCTPHEKDWLEDRLHWLWGEFDDNIFNGRKLILPTKEFFPVPIEKTKRGAEKLFLQVCGYMDVQPELIELDFFDTTNHVYLVNDSGDYLPAMVGSYSEGDDQFQIRLDVQQLENPMVMVGTIAHELAHVRLLGEGRYDGDAYDNELLTDLTVVFLGLGIFLANVPRSVESIATYWPDTNAKKPEYMTESMYGYALAHLAWFQNEKRPAWAQEIYWNTRMEFYQGLRYLRKTGNSTFRN
ncbi:MAG: hypothetical protein R3B84_12795 [Zavarzinella sp.]